MKWAKWITVAMLPLLTACGARDSKWDQPIDTPTGEQVAFGLTHAVVILDEPLDRAVVMQVTKSLDVRQSSYSIGKNVARAAVSADEQQLYVLAKGVQPRRRPQDERPSLTVIEGDVSPRSVARYELSDPLGGLSVDPLGDWVVVYDAGGVVVNPNELILVNVSEPKRKPINKTIRSFGGRPTRFTYTTPLTVPSGEARRFLIVETERDVTLIDLSDPEGPEVTVPLPQQSASKPGRPAQVVFTDGDPDDPSDAKIAIRLDSDSDLVMVELGEPFDSGRAFKASVNVSDAGGVPSALDFVQTDGGLRLAALIPTASQAVLIDPRTGVRESIALPGSYTHLARVTDDVVERPDDGDVALLWGGSKQSGIAYWSLGTTTGKPYRSVERYDVGIDVGAVKSVPGASFGHRKILQSTAATEFFVLDLNARTSFPMLTEAAGFDLTVAPDGRRAWALLPQGQQFARVDLDTLHPVSVHVERPVDAIFDIERLDGGRAAVALHEQGALGATVLDAVNPDGAVTRFHAGILLGGL